HCRSAMQTIAIFFYAVVLYISTVSARQDMKDEVEFSAINSPHTTRQIQDGTSKRDFTKRSAEVIGSMRGITVDNMDRVKQELEHVGANGFTYHASTEENLSSFEKSASMKRRKAVKIGNKLHGTSLHKEGTDHFEDNADEHGSGGNKSSRSITRIADTSDICFRRYANSIIVNAQPYERRSTITLATCKHHCLHSQSGIYKCNSIVYDNINQVCDLFAHVGDQPPARLLMFQTRDYYEPTFLNECIPGNNPSATLFSFDSSTTSNDPTDTENKPRDGSLSTNILGVPSNKTGVNDSPLMHLCPEGRLVRFLRTQGFELYKYDQWILEGVTIEECLDACANNSDALGNAVECHSVDFSKGRCVLSAESTVPLGSGQLKLMDDTDYYEKICVDENVASECPQIFDRYPQMILVGFAEVVIDSPTFEHCFDNCLNSYALHGMRCASGMYYYEEAQLNCILNVEDRITQKQLFTEENLDIVDYFEIRCYNRKERKPQSHFKAYSSKTIEMEVKDRAQAKELKVTDEWSEWSSCTDDRIQMRTRSCNGRICARDVRRCHPEMIENALNLTALKEQFNAKGITCAPDICCPVFGGCRVGLIQSTTTRRLEWCQNPCNNHNS
uniref:Apple domain-containing protein n=1 Tax=Parascaris univalens TaxID=6257 RepID=A0A915B912_PARUN